MEKLFWYLLKTRCGTKLTKFKSVTLSFPNILGRLKIKLVTTYKPLYCVATTIRGIPLEQKLKLVAQNLSFIAKLKVDSLKRIKET